MGAPGKAKRKLAKLGVPAFVLLALLITAPQAFAASPLKIREAFPGSTTTDPKAEYVELQMTDDGQNLISGQELKFYDSSGSPCLDLLDPLERGQWRKPADRAACDPGGG